MLKITVQRDKQPARFVLEGRLSGAWIEEAQQAWRALPKTEGAPLVVDLAGVTFVDADGKALLATMWREGADLQAADCCTKFIVEEITGRGRDPR
jgi:anti-anti-sigma regulatory factor